MKCKREGCNNQISIKATWCGDKCRKAQARSDKSDTQPGQIVPGQLNPDTMVIQPEQQATRTNPDRLNYGAYMNSDQLKQAGLTANHVPIPGDSDYSGACELVGGQWRVKQCA